MNEKLFAILCIVFAVMTFWVIVDASPNHTFTPFFEMLNGK